MSEPSRGAMAAAKALTTLTLEPHTLDNTACPQCRRVAEVIDRETHTAELVQAAQAAQCACSIKERDSGHLVGCWMPALSEALAKVTA
jgi:hypothetical protein